MRLLLVAVLLLSGCGADVELPPAQNLEASPKQLAAIPGLSRGPHAVANSGAIEWDLGNNVLRVRALYPKANGPFPLIVFSHGFGSDIDKYDAVLGHWASHGYVVVAPYHRDGGGTVRAIFNSMRLGNMGLIAARVADVEAVLDHVDELDALAPGLHARIDSNRIAVTGHSFGAFTAQQFGGAQAVDPESGERSAAARDPRVKAIVAISPPGEMFDVINAKSWSEMDAPMLATTGTWDVDGRFVTEWTQHALSFETAVPGNNWLLVIEGADHYLGNLICRPERKADPQTDALRMVNATTVTFLNAHVLGKPSAWNAMAEGQLETITDGFAKTSFR